MAWGVRHEAMPHRGPVERGQVMSAFERDASGLPVGVTADQVQAYREALRGMAPQTVWHTLSRAVSAPDEVPDGFQWRVPIMRMHLIVLEHRGERFLDDPAVMGLEGEERKAWMQHSARRFDESMSLREMLGREFYGDREYEQMRDAGTLPGGLRSDGGDL